MIDAVDGAVEFERLDDVGFDEGVLGILPRRWAMFCGFAGDEIIDADDFMALCEQQVG